jgi:hypothetical protein
VHIFYPNLKMSSEQETDQEIKDLLQLADSPLSNLPPGPKTKSTSSKPAGMEKSLITAEGEYLDSSPFFENEPEDIKQKRIKKTAYQMTKFPEYNPSSSSSSSSSSLQIPNAPENLNEFKLYTRQKIPPKPSTFHTLPAITEPVRDWDSFGQ